MPAWVAVAGRTSAGHSGPSTQFAQINNLRALFREANVHTYTTSDIQQQALPPVIGVDQLSQLLDKSPQTIFADRSRAPHKIPPACVAPGGKAPRWITADVIAWLRRHQESAAQTPAPDPLRRRPGRPTKAEQMRRRAAQAAEGGAA